jgi:hypothetical protein
MFVSVKVDMLLCLSVRFLLRWGRASTSSGTSVDSLPHPSLHYHDIGKTGDRVEGMRGYRRRWGRRGMRQWPVRGTKPPKPAPTSQSTMKIAQLEALKNEKDNVTRNAHEQLKSSEDQQTALVEQLKASYEDKKANLLRAHQNQYDSLRSELNEKHAQEMEKVNSSQSEQLGQLITQRGDGLRP